MLFIEILMGAAILYLFSMFQFFFMNLGIYQDIKLQLNLMTGLFNWVQEKSFLALSV